MWISAVTLSAGRSLWLQHFVDVTTDNSLDVRAAAITDFRGVLVEYIMQRMSSWEFTAQDIKEFLADISGDVFAERWIKPLPQ